MAFIPALAVAQTELVYSLGGSVVENVLHYQIPLASSPEILTLFAADVYDKWDELIKSYVPAEVSLTAIKVTDLTTQTSPAIVYSTNLPAPGLRPGQLLPNSVTCCFTKRTNFRGRSFRGRLYWPGFTETDVTGNTIAPSLITAITGTLNAMVTITSQGNPWPMVLVSRYHNNAPRTEAEVTPVSHFTCDGVVDSQRRRLPRRGQ